MDTHAELEKLLADLLDGPASAEVNTRLNDLLRAHRELQEEYLDHLQLHALLQWRAGIGMPQAVPQAGEGSILPQPAVRASRSTWPRWGLAAAAVLLAAGTGLLFLIYAPRSQAAPDVVDRLIDWNLALTQARVRAERNQIYAGQVDTILAALAKTDLTLEDRELATALLDTGLWLTRNFDPMAEANRFSDIADKFVTRIDAATIAQDDKQVAKLAESYRRLTEIGVDANLDLALTAGALDGERKKKLERVVRHDAKQMKKLEQILERNPGASHKAIHRALKGHFHRAKKHHKNMN